LGPPDLNQNAIVNGPVLPESGPTKLFVFGSQRCRLRTPPTLALCPAATGDRLRRRSNRADRYKPNRVGDFALIVVRRVEGDGTSVTTSLCSRVVWSSVVLLCSGSKIRPVCSVMVPAAPGVVGTGSRRVARGRSRMRSPENGEDGNRIHGRRSTRARWLLTPTRRSITNRSRQRARTAPESDRAGGFGSRFEILHRRAPCRRSHDIRQRSKCTAPGSRC